jgi:hypothetical protein
MTQVFWPCCRQSSNWHFAQTDCCRSFQPIARLRLYRPIASRLECAGKPGDRRDVPRFSPLKPGDRRDVPRFPPRFGKSVEELLTTQSARSRYLCMRSGKNRGTSRLSPHFCPGNVPSVPAFPESVQLWEFSSMLRPDSTSTRSSQRGERGAY